MNLVASSSFPSLIILWLYPIGFKSRCHVQNSPNDCQSASRQGQHPSCLWIPRSPSQTRTIASANQIKAQFELISFHTIHTLWKSHFKWGYNRATRCTCNPKSICGAQWLVRLLKVDQWCFIQALSRVEKQPSKDIFHLSAPIGLLPFNQNNTLLHLFLHLLDITRLAFQFHMICSCIFVQLFVCRSPIPMGLVMFSAFFYSRPNLSSFLCPMTCLKKACRSAGVVPGYWSVPHWLTSPWRDAQTTTSSWLMT